MKNWKSFACALFGVMIVGVGCSDNSDPTNSNLADVGLSDVGQEDSGRVDEDAGDEDASAGEDAGDEDVSAGEDAVDEDASAGEDAVDDDVSAGEDAVDEDVSAGEDAVDDDASAGEDAVDEDVSAGEDAVDEDVSAGEDAVDDDASAGEDVELPVTIRRDDKDFTFTQAGYGLTSPEKSADGVWEIYLDMWEGGFRGCTTEGSPTPWRELILFGLTVDEDENLNIPGRLSLALLDYRGEVFPSESSNPISHAISVSAVGKSWEFCKECVGGTSVDGRKNGELVIELNAEFERGTLTGTVRAQHCESMDMF